MIPFQRKDKESFEKLIPHYYEYIQSVGREQWNCMHVEIILGKVCRLSNNIDMIKSDKRVNY